MSVDIYANQFDVMEWHDIKEIVPEEAAAFERLLQEVGMDVDEFCLGFEYERMDSDSQDADRIMDAWDKLDEAFTKATTVEGAGLELEPEYHDPEHGDAAAFFAVLGVHQLTPAGAKYEKKIERKQFFGVG